MDLRLNFRETALLVIDVQEQFCRPDNWAADLPSRISGYVRGISRKGIPVVYTKTVGDADRVPENVKRFRQLRGHSSGALTNETGAQLCPMYLAPGALIIEKPCFDAFAYTSLGECLRRRGIRDVLVCGVMTDVCVDATARRAVMEGFNTFVLEDLVAAPPDHRDHASRTLAFFDRFYGYVVRSSAVQWNGE